MKHKDGRDDKEIRSLHAVIAGGEEQQLVHYPFYAPYKKTAKVKLVDNLALQRHEWGRLHRRHY